MAGLRANQAALSLVSSNVANAETPGYVRKTTNQIQTAVGTGAGVETIGVNRVLDDYIQSQLRTETSGASYTRTRATFLNNLQSVYGDPDSAATIEAAFNSLTTALQSLSTSPDSQSARTGVLNAAQALAQQLNSTSQGIQSLRNSAETGITNAVSTANNALTQIAKINRQLQGYTNQDAATAALLDQRDQFITQLSQLMDVRVVKGEGNQVSVYTTSGTQLVGGSDAAQLTFNTQGTVTPESQWNADPSKSTLGTISISYPNGGSIDLISSEQSVPGRSQPISNCATRRWCRRRIRSTSSRQRWRARCPTGRQAARHTRPPRLFRRQARRPASISISQVFRPATPFVSPTPTAPVFSAICRSSAWMIRVHCR